jgi:hypothetical protein
LAGPFSQRTVQVVIEAFVRVNDDDKLVRLVERSGSTWFEVACSVSRPGAEQLVTSLARLAVARL